MQNTILKETASARCFGHWLVENGYLEVDPFAFIDDRTAATKKARQREQRMKAVRRVEEPSYDFDVDRGAGIGVDDVPPLSVVSQLRDAIFTVETQSTHLLTFHNRRLDPNTAHQTESHWV